MTTPKERPAPHLSIVRDVDAPARLPLRLEPAVALYGMPCGTQVLLAWQASLPASGCGRCSACAAFPFRGGRACLIPESVARG